MDAAQGVPPAQRNRLCELRRALDVLLSNGGRGLLSDPRLKQVALSFLRYIEGTTPAARGTAHYDLFTTFGRMAQNPGICPTASLYVLLDRSLAHLTPQVVPLNGPDLATHPRVTQRARPDGCLREIVSL